MSYTTKGQIIYDDDRDITASVNVGETVKQAVLYHDKGCILCNKPVNDIAHIIAKMDRLDWQVVGI
jgi:hypothetical protein